MDTRQKIVSTLMALSVATVALARDHQVREYFIAPQDGAVVSSPVHVIFGLEGMGVAPAGVEHPDTGHHHLLIDAPPPPPGQPIPADAQHLHFGHGQTETRVALAPGEHSLQLVLADARHVPFDPPVMSRRITITVRAPAD